MTNSKFQKKIKIKKLKKLWSSENGITLLWTMLITVLLLLIVATMVSIMVKEIRFSVNIDDASRAYFAAEAGLEKGMKIAQEMSPDLPDTWPASGEYEYPKQDIVSNLSFTLTIKLTDREDTDFDGTLDQFKSAIIESLGTSNGINRKVQTIFNPPTRMCIDTYEYLDQDFDSDPRIGLDLRPPGGDYWKYHDIKGECKPSSPLTTGGRQYAQEFTLKLTEPPVSGPGPNRAFLGVGLAQRDGSGQRKETIMVKFYPESAAIYIKSNDGTIDEETETLVNWEIGKTYKIRIAYVPNSAVKVKITSDVGDCINLPIFDLVSRNDPGFNMDLISFEYQRPAAQGTIELNKTDKNIHMESQRGAAQSIKGDIDNMIVIIK